MAYFNRTAPKLTSSVIQFWTSVGRCETGGGGPPKWDWGKFSRPGEGSTYVGGVGFYAGTWDEWANELGIENVYPHPYDAPAGIQMRVAEYGYRVHHGYWGCIS